MARFLFLLPEHLYFSEDVFSSGESVSLKFMFGGKSALFFFVRYLNLYKKFRKQYGECILNFIAWSSASPSLYSKE